MVLMQFFSFESLVSFSEIKMGWFASLLWKARETLLILSQPLLQVADQRVFSSSSLFFPFSFFSSFPPFSYFAPFSIFFRFTVRCHLVSQWVRRSVCWSIPSFLFIGESYCHQLLTHTVSHTHIFTQSRKNACIFTCFHLYSRVFWIWRWTSLRGGYHCLLRSFCGTPRVHQRGSGCRRTDCCVENTLVGLPLEGVAEKV